MNHTSVTLCSVLVCGCMQGAETLTEQVSPSAPATKEAQPVSASAPCWVVYIPGLGNDGATDTRTDAQRRDYWRTSRTDRFGDFVAWSSRETTTAGCTTLVTGYANGAAFWSATAAGEVARQINAFITAHDIPERSLVLIGHSMGALVGRWMLNNGVEGSLFYNFEGADFARVTRHTKYMLSFAGPHLGSPIADAVHTETDTVCGNFVGWLAASLGRRDDATDSLRRVTLEPASASGGWMADVGRDRTIYTAAGQRWDSGNGQSTDRLLSGAWWCLGLSDCRFGCTETPGDGVVAESSAVGLYTSDGDDGEHRWSRGRWMLGRRVDWLRLGHNHNHLRYDDQRLTITDVRDGSSAMHWPGSYVALHGLDLE